jgi:hypothetical protein
MLRLRDLHIRLRLPRRNRRGMLHHRCHLDVLEPRFRWMSGSENARDSGERNQKVNLYAAHEKASGRHMRSVGETLASALVLIYTITSLTRSPHCSIACSSQRPSKSWGSHPGRTSPHEGRLTIDGVLCNWIVSKRPRSSVSA